MTLQFSQKNKSISPVSRPWFHAVLLGLLGFCGATLNAAEFEWNGNSLYNGTHPSSPNPWTTKWVPGPNGTQSIEVTVEKGAGYYNYIALPQQRFGNGTDFTAEITFRVTTPTVLPNTFYMFARNSKSNAYDLWQNWVSEPGLSRTIRFPMQLTPVDGGTWTFYVGCHGTGSIIIDRLAIREGREIVRHEAVENIDPVSRVSPETKIAEGAGTITVEPPAAGENKTISAQNLLIPDSGSPASPEVAVANAAALQSLFKQAQAMPGSKTLFIPKGIYRFAGKAPMRLENTKDLVIDGQGSEFIFQNLFKAECFSIVNCERILFKNLALDWNWDYKPIASLGKLNSISEDKMTAEFEFPDLNEKSTLLASESVWMALMPMDPATLYRTPKLQPNGFSISKAPKLSVSGNHITAVFAEPLALEAGLSYCIRHLYYDQNAFKMSNCSNFTFEDITIYSMPGMGWLNTGKTNHWQFINCKIVRREGSRHPLTTAADGIHTNESDGDLLIKNCEFTGLGDDAINLHDNSWQGGLTRGENETQLRFSNCPKHRLRLETGDVIRFYNPDFSPANIELKVAAEPVFEGKPNAYAGTATMTINFTTPVPKELSPLAIAINTKFETHNVRIADCRFLRLFGRAILFAGRAATIENNTFREVYNTPIQIQTDIVDNHWGEGHGTSNLVIRNNIFENSNFAGRWEGAVVYLGGRIPWGPTESPLFKSILLEKNRFLNPAGPAMSFNFTRDVVARDNTIEIKTPAPNATPYAGTILANLSSDLWLGGNTWINRTGSSQPSGVVFARDSTKALEPGTNRLESNYRP